VKFMLLIYNNAAAIAAMPQADRDKIFADVDEIMKELTASGEMVGGAALSDVSLTKTVSSPGGVLTTTDGPYLESKEHFAGYITVDVDSVERAVEIAERWPDSRYGAMEVRGFMDTGGMEM
jgi:hypothetical protein